jgi:hypothetical protein
VSLLTAGSRVLLGKLITVTLIVILSAVLFGNGLGTGTNFVDEMQSFPSDCVTVQIMQLHTIQSPAVNSYRILSGPNIFLSNIFLNALNLCSTLSTRHKASYGTKQEKKFFEGDYPIFSVFHAKYFLPLNKC